MGGWPKRHNYGEVAYDGISDVEYFGIVKNNRDKEKAFKIVSVIYKTYE
jgi:hypothetical protein